MAPKKELRGANKRLSNVTEVSHDNDAENVNNIGHRATDDVSYQGKPARNPEKPVSNVDIQGKENDSSVSSIQLQATNEVKLTIGIGSERKRDMPKSHIQKDVKSIADNTKGYPNLAVQSLHDEALELKGKLSNCLSRYEVRRWCSYEWHYSAVDYPWFATREYGKFVNHIGLGHVLRFTRAEWSIIRSALGRPRRFSGKFLEEEREKLYQHRESARKLYAEIHAGTKGGLPDNLAPALSAGQRVFALHPKTREIHDGSVLTVDQSRYRIQFDQHEIGVEFVKDIDCAQKPLENVPPLAKDIGATNKLLKHSTISRVNEQSKEKKVESYTNIPSYGNLENISVPLLSSLPGYGLSQISKKDRVQPNEGDIQAIEELDRLLNKKKVLLAEITRMNDEVENQKDGGSSLKDSEIFRKHYAAILVQMHKTNEQLLTALSRLRERNNIYQGISAYPCINAEDSGSLFGSSWRLTSHPQQSGSHISEIIESSMRKARMMVDATIKASSGGRTGATGSAETVEEAINFINNRLNSDDPHMTALRSPALIDLPCVTKGGPDQMVAGSADSSTSNSGAELDKHSHQTERIPSELITHCITAFIMIQKCTERQLSPADVAQVLDHAVSGLRPSCPQNHQVYAEIQRCMQMIKNQILTLVDS